MRISASTFTSRHRSGSSTGPSSGSAVAVDPSSVGGSSPASPVGVAVALAPSGTCSSSRPRAFVGHPWALRSSASLHRSNGPSGASPPVSAAIASWCTTSGMLRPPIMTTNSTRRRNCWWSTLRVMPRTSAREDECTAKTVLTAAGRAGGTCGHRSRHRGPPSVRCCDQTRTTLPR
ncbi:hypothetical protein [Ornithinimicrobium kibberense]|uniref:hypothetical protein n=1 Tax=Ornithinimicrobium kibberense TaxID=282060 RepID=UPI0036245308